MEFRPLDSPITHKEKSVLVFLTILFKRMILDPRLAVNFYIPISLTDLNLIEANKSNS